MFNIFYHQRIEKSPYYPFAFLSEINISQQPNYFAESLISQLLPNIKVPDQDEQMIIGKYQRYPLGKTMETTSVVAIEPNLNDFPLFTAWNIEVDINAWNFVWCDSGSSYFVTPISLIATPLVVLKGTFPKCRYMSIYGYAGLDSTESGEILFGQGVTKDGNIVCNATVKEGNLKCQGLRDYEIKPDEGSKNPFVDKNFNEFKDDAFYTIYIKSPYYNGPLPKGKNIINMSIYGAKTALILYRIYSPFNPKSCKSKQYWSKVSFDTMGCENINNKQILTGEYGGSVNYRFDKNSICKIGDSVCYNKCIADKLGHSDVPECNEYLGNNLYCICQNPNSPCYDALNGYIKDCTNGMGNINNFCAKAPQKNVDNCISKVKCSDDDETCNDYLRNSNMQICIGKKLLQSTNNDCYQYKDPNKICNICKGFNTKDDSAYTSFKKDSCQAEFKKIVDDCSKVYWSTDPNKQFTMKTYCNVRCRDPPLPQSMQPSFGYNPNYNFNTTPIPCESNKYDCINGNCFPSPNGKFSDSNCENQCYYTNLMNESKENYTDIPSNDISTETPRPKIKKLRPCIFKFNEKDCDINSLKYKDIDDFGLSSVPPEKIFRQGWVDLPQCFIKYNYNNYFIKLNNWNLQKMWKLSLYKSLEPAINSLMDKNSVNPNIKENFEINDVSDKLNCAYNTIISGGDGDVNNCFNDEQSSNLYSNDQNNNCDKYVNKDSYFYIGSQFPVSNFHLSSSRNNQESKKILQNRSDRSSRLTTDDQGNPKDKTFKSKPPFCNYYLEYCQCTNQSNRQNNCCESTLGRLNCDGSPCFKKWKNQETTFSGIAQVFAASANTGNVIPFPNPDLSYLGCCTSYDADAIYIIWADTPTFPHTPDFNNIIKNDYDLRYFSFGHYYWNMTPSNPRPVLSDLLDAEIKTIQTEYIDEYTKQKIIGNRACIILASFEQYKYMKSYNILDEERVNWLNWGKVQMGDNMTDMKKFQNPNEIENVVSNKLNKGKKLQVNDHIPQKGLILYRQLFPNQNFKEAIANFNDSDCFKNVEKTVQTKFEKSNEFTPRNIPKFCNPGPGNVSKFDSSNPNNNDLDQSICKYYELDPCCLSRDALYLTKNYYPRCEKVKICDIEKEGYKFWDKYFSSLPYQFDENPIRNYNP